MTLEILLILLFFSVAILYSIVGHGGASGYIAIMALFSFPANELRFYALILNLLVSGIAFVSFLRAGHFKIKVLLPFVIISIPFAYLGGSLNPNIQFLHVSIAVCLIIAASQMIYRVKIKETEELRPIVLTKALPAGAIVGFISGIIGIGGGILLSPLLLFFKWANVKTTAAVSAAFIFLNSMAGIAGQFNPDKHISPNFIAYAIVVMLGGLWGSRMGSIYFSNFKLRLILSTVLTVASFKLLFSV
jgi:uncharacterized membrane protein YfcA